MKNIEAVAFDIDGTLYPNWQFYFYVLPFVIKNLKLMNAFRKVRKKLRELEDEYPLDDLLHRQSELMTEFYSLSTNANSIKKELENKIYNGWKPLFNKLKPYPHSLETVKKLKSAGLKIGLLSDFPPEQKGNVWGILPLCDCVIGSEDTGALKPSPIPFKALAKKLNTSPENILYVGNSFEYDIKGAASIGMQTAYICSHIKKAFSLKTSIANLCFSSYNELADFVLRKH